MNTARNHNKIDVLPPLIAERISVITRASERARGATVNMIGATVVPIAQAVSIANAPKSLENKTPNDVVVEAERIVNEAADKPQPIDDPYTALHEAYENIGK